MGTGLRILKGKSAGKTLYRFSQDLHMSCREFAATAKQTGDLNMAFSMTIACALLGGSYLEARLNELIAEMAHTAGTNERPSQEFWMVLFNEQKYMPVQQKWDLIASTAGGRLWDSSTEPFQSYDVLVCLRNELAHYKGNVTSTTDPPVKKLKSLMARFNGQPDPMMKILRVASWIDDLLSSQELGTWISGVVADFDANIYLYLFGKHPKTVRVNPPRKLARARRAHQS